MSQDKRTHVVYSMNEQQMDITQSLRCHWHHHHHHHHHHQRPYSLFVELLAVFQFLILYTVSRTFSQGSQLHKGQHKQNKRTQTSMPRVGFEPMTLTFERVKRVHALHRVPAVTINGNTVRGTT
jgi:hypothetical protein